MEIKRIDGSIPEMKEGYLDISATEIRAIHNKIVLSHKISLERYDVKKLWRDDLPDHCSDEEFVSLLDAKEYKNKNKSHKYLLRDILSLLSALIIAFFIFVISHT